jgi:hypothetical protein
MGEKGAFYSAIIDLKFCERYNLSKTYRELINEINQSGFNNLINEINKKEH